MGVPKSLTLVNIVPSLLPLSFFPFITNTVKYKRLPNFRVESKLYLNKDYILVTTAALFLRKHGGTEIASEHCTPLLP